MAQTQVSWVEMKGQVPLVERAAYLITEEEVVLEEKEGQEEVVGQGSTLSEELVQQEETAELEEMVGREGTVVAVKGAALKQS